MTDLNHLSDRSSDIPKCSSLPSNTLWFRETNAFEISTNNKPVTFNLCKGITHATLHILFVEEIKLQREQAPLQHPLAILPAFCRVQPPYSLSVNARSPAQSHDQHVLNSKRGSELDTSVSKLLCRLLL